MSPFGKALLRKMIPDGDGSTLLGCRHLLVSEQVNKAIWDTVKVLQRLYEHRSLTI